ncbi:FAS1 domain-containing protein [Lentinus tigrinus ALCF2SS1-7]|uniref:FAS1 domain-containing protein n=1 Tax=Lentinus tigrinus ALCF2SS1-6 TaxID=1328759 RepID=A0A5C2SD84_9APHY|nr:FAS1 domain-containing protein [Lentinus tigrinus ALCF2SS1-6]RPD68739.1 FAS1 domain-containing protein [Lentinus tigrinus ALCF2SS1-7]
MRFFTAAALLLASVPAVLGQNATLLAGLISLLNDAGLSQLVNVTSQVNTSAAGPSVLAQLSSGGTYVLFAPNNTAFQQASSRLPSDLDGLTDLIAYHIVSGNFTGVSTNYTNTTLGRTLLSDPKFVQLEASGEHQVLAWANRSDGQVHVLNQLNDTIVTNATTYGNITVYTIDNVLTIPETFAQTVPVNNASLFSTQAALSLVSVPYYNSSTNQTTNETLFEVLNSGLHGFTLFAPNNTAVQSVESNLTSLSSNQTALITLFQNHLINGSTVYSPLLSSANSTSAAGEPLTFVLNATGHYVTSGNVTARIVQPDVLLPNGVIHVIDRVLVNVQSDPSAASSA